MELQTNTTYIQFIMVTDLLALLQNYQPLLAIYDMPIESVTYTGSENIGITNNQISLNFTIEINDEIVMHPRAYGIQFEMYAGTSGFAFLQNQQDGGQPIAMLNSLDRSCDLFGDADIPFVYYKSEIISILANSNFSDPSNYYNKTEIDAIVSNINFSNDRYTKAETDDIDNELSTLMLNTYTKTEIDDLVYTN